MTAQSPNHNSVAFDAQEYLERYFVGSPPAYNTTLMKFWARVYPALPRATMLEFGGGPTLYSIISAATIAPFIHFTDYSRDCRMAVDQWVKQQPNAFDWTEYIRAALQFENGGQPASDAEVQARANLLRQRLQLITACNAWAEDPLLGHALPDYGIVATNFCLDSLTDDIDEWTELNRNVAAFVAEGGFYIISTLWNASTYSHHGKQYQCVTVTPEDVTTMYRKLGFQLMHLETTQLDDIYYGYIMACGCRS